jgi:predicted transcriptional regulator
MRKVVKAARPVATSVRFDPAVKTAIDKAARADARSASSLIQKVMADWLKANGFLK